MEPIRWEPRCICKGEKRATSAQHPSSCRARGLSFGFGCVTTLSVARAYAVALGPQHRLADLCLSVYSCLPTRSIVATCGAAAQAVWQRVNFTWFSTFTSEFAISINSVRARVCPRVCVLRQNKWRKELHMQIVCIAARPAYRARHLPFWLCDWDSESESGSDLAQARDVCVLGSRCCLCSAHLPAGDFTSHPDLRIVISRNQSRRPKQVEITVKSNRAATIAKMCCKKSNSLLTAILQGFFEVFSKLNHL